VLLSKMQNKAPAWSVISQIPITTGSAATAWSAYLDTTAEAAQGADGGNGLIQRLLTLPAWLRWKWILTFHYPSLIKHPELYGSINYTLYLRNEYRRLLEWTNTWKKKDSSLEPYMVNNLFLSCLRLGKMEEANQYLDLALQYPRHDSIRMRLCAFASINALQQSGVDLADDWLHSVNPSMLNPYSNSIYDFAKLLRKTFDPTPPDFDEASGQIIQTYFDTTASNKGLLQIGMGACRLMARKVNSKKPLILAYKARYSNLLTILAVILFLIIFILLPRR
jgi:hypothetical protein